MFHIKEVMYNAEIICTIIWHSSLLVHMERKIMALWIMAIINCDTGLLL
jgi:hypothetical protein